MKGDGALMWGYWVVEDSSGVTETDHMVRM